MRATSIFAALTLVTLIACSPNEDATGGSTDTTGKDTTGTTEVAPTTGGSTEGMTDSGTSSGTTGDGTTTGVMTGTTGDTSTGDGTTEIVPTTGGTADPEPSCGDGKVNLGEQCDDGNAVDTDSCRNNCIKAACGDGVLWEEKEQCDDGNLDNTDQCDPYCLVKGDINDSCAAACGKWSTCEDGVPPEICMPLCSKLFTDPSCVTAWVAYNKCLANAPCDQFPAFCADAGMTAMSECANESPLTLLPWLELYP